MNWTKTVFNMNLCLLELFRHLKERLHRKVVVAIACVWLLWFYRKPIGNQSSTRIVLLSLASALVLRWLGSYWEISQSMEFANEILWITSHRLPEWSRVSISAVFVLRWIDVLSAVWRVFALHTDYESHKCRWSTQQRSSARVCTVRSLWPIAVQRKSALDFSQFLTSVYGIIQSIIIKNV